MSKYTIRNTPKTDRITRLVNHLFEKMPQVESERAVLVTESYKQTENLPIILRRSRAFRHILENIPIVIRPDELVVGSATKAMTAANTRDKIPKINRLLSFISTFSCHKNSSASVAIEQPQARKGKNGMAMGWRSRESLRNRRAIGMAKTAATKKTRAIPEGP